MIIRSLSTKIRSDQIIEWDLCFRLFQAFSCLEELIKKAKSSLISSEKLETVLQVAGLI